MCRKARSRLSFHKKEGAAIPYTRRVEVVEKKHVKSADGGREKRGYLQKKCGSDFTKAQNS